MRCISMPFILHFTLVGNTALVELTELLKCQNSQACSTITTFMRAEFPLLGNLKF